jgi:hypothetical protein
LKQATLADTVISATSIGDCLGGQWLQLRFARESFIFCSSESNRLVHGSGQDIDLVIEYLDDPTLLPEFVIPNDVDGQRGTLDCPMLVPENHPATSMYNTLLQTSSELLNVATGNERVASIEASSCGCKMAKKKPCLFVHGVGNSENAPPTPTYDSWGNIHEHAPCCSSTHFAHFDTLTQPWTSPTLQKQLCDTAYTVSEADTGASSNEVGDLILVTHSMGNLITGGALANGICSFSSNVTWVSIGAPMEGSKAANFLEEKCQGNNWGLVVKLGLSRFGFCPATESYLSIRHQSTVNTTLNAEFAQAQMIRQQYATKVMCGVSGYGLNSPMSSGLHLVGSLAEHMSNEEDGLVDFPSCSVGLGEFSTNAMDGVNYRAALNHYDIQFRYGDGWWGEDRKPLKWFECAL